VYRRHPLAQSLAALRSAWRGEGLVNNQDSCPHGDDSA